MDCLGTDCGGCFGECVPAPPDGCESDADCGEGEYCEIQWCTDCIGGSACGCFGICVPEQPDPCDGVTCPEGTHCEPWYGDASCVPDESCNTDDDCPEGFVCEPGICPYFVACTPEWCPPCYGKCVPSFDPCDGIECEPGTHCEISPLAIYPPEPWCVPDDPCDGIECEPGYHCEQSPLEIYPPIGECVPNEFCEGDNDCPDGEVCNYQICPMMGEADGARMMAPCTPDWCPACYGVCEPAGQDPCADCPDDWTCDLTGGSLECRPPDPGPCMASGCSGEICADVPMDSICIWQAWYVCLEFTTCELQPSAECGWTPTPELLECLAENGFPG